MRGITETLLGMFIIRPALDLFLFTALVCGWLLLRRKKPQRVSGNREWYRNVYLRSLHWRSVRAQKIKETGGKCERCGVGGSLDIHHLSYKNLGHERMSDLQALCRKCHKKRHKK